MDPRRAEQELLELRARLLEQDEDLGESLAVNLEDQAGEESSDQHMADVGTVTFSRELDLSLQYNTEQLLAQVDRALQKIEEGSYGRCDRCGSPIEEGRLEAVPYATLCLRHQREVEQAPA
jgi:RNA polymerase-binding protein DksA